MSDKLREAAEAMCQGCRDGWPARKIVGDRIYWWHDFGNISRECECAPIQKLIEQAALSVSPAPALCNKMITPETSCTLLPGHMGDCAASPASTKETGARDVHTFILECPMCHRKTPEIEWTSIVGCSVCNPGRLVQAS